MLKYLFFLVLGIIIYILLNDKDRFSIGIPGGDKLDFLPDDFSDNVTTRILKQPIKFYELRHESQESSDKIVIERFIQYKSRQKGALADTQYGVKITYDKKVCASMCKSCCKIESFGDKPNSIKDFLNAVLPDPGIRYNLGLTNDPTSDLAIAGAQLHQADLTNTTNMYDNLFLDRPLVTANSDRTFIHPFTDFQAKGIGTVMYQNMQHVMNGGRGSDVRSDLIYVHNVDEAPPIGGIGGEGSDGIMITYLCPDGTQNCSMSGIITRSGQSYECWWTKYDPYLDPEFWDTLINDLIDHQECMSPSMSLVSNFRLDTMRSSFVGGGPGNRGRIVGSMLDRFR